MVKEGDEVTYKKGENVTLKGKVLRVTTTSKLTLVSVYRMDGNNKRVDVTLLENIVDA